MFLCSQPCYKLSGCFQAISRIGGLMGMYNQSWELGFNESSCCNKSRLTASETGIVWQQSGQYQYKPFRSICRNSFPEQQGQFITKKGVRRMDERVDKW